MKKRILAMLMASVLTLAATACGGGNSGSASESAGASAATVGNGNTDTIIVSLEAEPNSMDPGQVSDSNSYRVLFEMYDKLVTWEDSGYTVKPSLASDWEISPDGLTYTFHLVENATFHDGSPVNADAVVYSFERQIDADHPAAGTGPFPMAKTYLATVESVEATDEYTVVFHLSAPTAAFINYLAQNFASIVNPAVIDANLSDTSMVDAGSGPYQLVSWDKGVGVTLTRYDGYWGDAAKTQNVYFEPVTESLVRVQKLQNGESDIIVNVEPDLIADVEANGFQVDQRAGTHVWFLVPNMSKAPFDNALVREALNYAIDREAICNDILGGTGTVANQMLSPACMSHIDDLENYEYNPEKARELLAEAGYPDGFTCKFLLPESGSGMQSCVAMCTLIQAYLGDVGITADMTTVEFSTYMDIIFGDSCYGDDGQYDLWAMSWTSSSGDDSSCLKQLFSVENIPAYNSGYYYNEKITELLNEANATTDQEVRKGLFQEICRMINDDNAAIFVDYGNQVVASNPSISGLMLHPDQVLRLSRVTKS